MSYDPNDFWFWVSFLNISSPWTSPGDNAAQCGNEPSLPFIPTYLPDILPMCYYAAFYIQK